MIVILGAFLIQTALSPATETGKTANPPVREDSPRVAVDFELVRGNECCEVVVTIIDQLGEQVTAEHPANRYALTFIVMNELGNVIAPTGFAKVKAATYEDIVLKPGEVLEHRVRASGTDKYLFQFLSGSALFGYKLEAGSIYRIVAIYRPDGKDGEGICSKEKIVRFDAHLHEVRSN